MILGFTLQEIFTVLLPVIGAAVMWLFQSYQTWIKDKSDIDTSKGRVELDAEAQQNALTFDLLQAARNEVAEMRAEIAMLRPLQRSTFQLEQALMHLENIVTAPNKEIKYAAEESARMFLARTKD